MSNNLTISFSTSITTVDYWVRTEQIELVPDVATLGEVAELVDSLYDINSCAELEVVSVAEATTPKQFSIVDVENSIKSSFKLPTCGTDNYGNWSTSVKVVISHPEADPLVLYNLRLSNGNVTGTSKETFIFKDTISVKDDYSLQLKWPILYHDVPRHLDKEIVYGWVGQVTSGTETITPPTIKAIGTRLEWDVEATGQIYVKYPTRYYNVSIIVFGTLTGDLGKCNVMTWYRDTFFSEELEPPEQSQEDQISRELFCKDPLSGVAGSGGSSTTVVPWEKEQWVTYITRYYCDCTKKFSHEVRENDPDDWDKAVSDKYSASRAKKVAAFNVKSSNIEESNKLNAESAVLYQEAVSLADQHDKARKEYGFPPKEEIRFGGYVNCNEETHPYLADPEYYESVCCHQKPNDLILPSCLTKYGSVSGGGLSSKTVQKLKSKYGDSLRLIGVAPEDGWCGTLTTKQKLPTGNCCEFVEDMEWNYEDSASSLADYDSGLVYVIGGKQPYNWTIKGEEFYFDADLSKKKITTTTPYVRIYTGDACGVADIGVDDSCSTTEGTIRSLSGEWYTVTYRSWNYYYGTGSSNRSCTPDQDEGDAPIPPPETELEVESEWVDTNKTSWWRQVYQGEYLFKEAGGSNVKVRTEGGDYDCDDSSPSRLEDENTWPDCIGVPEGVEPADCTSWACIYCCKEFDDFVQKSDRYGVTSCGTRTYYIGWNIYSREWKKWRC